MAALGRGPVQPRRFLEVGRAAAPFAVQTREAERSPRLPLSGSLGVPGAGERRVRRHPLAGLVHVAKQELGAGIALLGRQAIPAHGVAVSARNLLAGEKRGRGQGRKRCGQDEPTNHNAAPMRDSPSPTLAEKRARGQAAMAGDASRP